MNYKVSLNKNHVLIFYMQLKKKRKNDMRKLYKSFIKKLILFSLNIYYYIFLKSCIEGIFIIIRINCINFLMQNTYFQLFHLEISKNNVPTNLLNSFLVLKHTSLVTNKNPKLN